MKNNEVQSSGEQEHRQNQKKKKKSSAKGSNLMIIQVTVRLPIMLIRTHMLKQLATNCTFETLRVPS